jgi:hypothetical protein
MKSFASLHYRGTQSELKIDFDRPSFAKFVHELYKQSARKIWQMAYYFKTVGVSSEQQARNRQDIEKIVTDCMEQVIRSFLPWEAIAKKYFADDEYVPERLPTLETPAPRVVPVAPPTQQVTFDDADLEEEDEEEEGSDGTEDDRSELNLGDEDATIEFEDLDKKPEEPAKKDEEPEKEEEDDPLKEIEGKVTEDTLVLNL